MCLINTAVIIILSLFLGYVFPIRRQLRHHSVGSNAVKRPRTYRTSRVRLPYMGKTSGIRFQQDDRYIN